MIWDYLDIVILILLATLVVLVFYGKIKPLAGSRIAADGFYGFLHTRVGNRSLFLPLFLSLGIVYFFLRFNLSLDAPNIRALSYSLPVLAGLLLYLYGNYYFSPLLSAQEEVKNNPAPGDHTVPHILLLGETIKHFSTFTRDNREISSLITIIHIPEIYINGTQFQLIQKRFKDKLIAPDLVLYDSPSMSAGEEDILAGIPAFIPRVDMSELEERYPPQNLNAIQDISSQYSESIRSNMEVLSHLDQSRKEDLYRIVGESNYTISTLITRFFLIQNNSQKIMVLFNMHEMAQKLICFVSFSRFDIEHPSELLHYVHTSGHRISDTPRTWIRYLEALAEKDTELYEILYRRLPREIYGELISNLYSFLRIDFKSEEMTFIDLLEIMIFIRNKTRGHGIIKDVFAGKLSPYYFCAVLTLLKISTVSEYSYKIAPIPDAVLKGYRELSELSTFDAERKVLLKNNRQLLDPRFLMEFSGEGDVLFFSEYSPKKTSMIGYLSGEVAIPQRVHIDAE